MSPGGVAAQHVGVCHPWHRRVGVAFAASVAGGRDAHQPRVLAVLHIADRMPSRSGVLLRRRALVVDGDGPRRSGMVPSSSTVTPGAAMRWPIRPAKARLALAVEVALQPVADGFVQQDTGPARAQGRRPSRRRGRARRRGSRRRCAALRARSPPSGRAPSARSARRARHPRAEPHSRRPFSSTMTETLRRTIGTGIGDGLALGAQDLHPEMEAAMEALTCTTRGSRARI